MPNFPGKLALVAMTSLALTAACSKPASTGTPADASPGEAMSSAPADAGTHNAKDEEMAISWRAAVRLGLWERAMPLLDALPKATRQKPAMRFLRGIVALKNLEPEKALELLQNSGGSLPLLQPELESYIAEALLAAGHHLEAATLLGQRQDAESLLGAAVAFRRAGHPDKAQTMLSKVFPSIESAPKSTRKHLEAQARALRSKITLEGAKPAAALSDLRWLALEAPTSAEAGQAAGTLESLEKGKYRLKAKERYQRALAFADEGRVEETERELGLVAAAPGPPPTAAQKTHAQGWAWYLSRKDYDEAARLLSAAAAMGGNNKTRNRYYAARALARAHRDHEAIRKLQALVKDSPQTSWAGRAMFLVARLQYVLGEWKHAATSFDAYLRRYGAVSEYGKTAKYSRAVSMLAAGDFAPATKAFSDLVENETNSERRGRYRELLGAALVGKGDHRQAKIEFERVIRNHPLSFPAVAAAARLRAMGTAPPRHFAPVKTSETPSASAPAPPLNVVLPAKASLLASLGLDAQAEDALRVEESALAKQHTPRDTEALCIAYGRLWAAARRYQIGQRNAGWQPIRSALSHQNSWYWQCNYPTPYAPFVEALEKKRTIPRWLTHAVMRQESAFRPKVRSPAGAVGLMQLMPSTALKVAAELGVEHSENRLETPSHNIDLGGAYLAKLLGFFDRNVALVIPAYNAGPKAVSHWLESGEKLPLDLFVARIPYAETRNYTYRVLQNLANYRYIASNAQEELSLELELPTGTRAPEDAY